MKDLSNLNLQSIAENEKFLNSHNIIFFTNDFGALVRGLGKNDNDHLPTVFLI